MTQHKSKYARGFRLSLTAMLCVISFVAAGAVVAHTGGARLLKIANVTTARPEINVTLAGSVRRDDTTLALGKAEAVRPNEVLTWTLTATNNGAAAARNFSTVGQIPRGTTFIAGSASGQGATVSYSIDNGKTFAAQPMINETQPDGSIVVKPAPVAAYTQVRYEWADALAAHQAFNANYQVRVR